MPPPALIANMLVCKWATLTNVLAYCGTCARVKRLVATWWNQLRKQSFQLEVG
jgi:hypothetical protein